MSLPRSRTAAAAALLAMPLLCVVVHLVARPHLPGQIPDPLAWAGAVLGESPQPVDPDEFWGDLFVCLLFLVPGLVVIARYQDRRAAGSGLVVTLVGALFVFGHVAAELGSLGGVDAEAVDSSRTLSLAIMLAFLGYAVLIAALLPYGPLATRPTPRSSITLSPAVQVLWLGRARAPLHLLPALPFAASGALVMSFHVTAGVALVVVAAAATLAWGTTVRISNTGVRFSRSPGWPSRTVPLATINGARSLHLPFSRWREQAGHDDVDPRSVVVRTGATLVVETVDRPPLFVSVDQADEAADVLNALVARARAAEPATG